MVDIVVNHFVSPGPASVTKYSTFSPFNNISFFHPFCEVSNYDDQDMVEECWLGDSRVRLADVNTQDPRVISIFDAWISSLVSKYSSKELILNTNQANQVKLTACASILQNMSRSRSFQGSAKQQGSLLLARY